MSALITKNKIALQYLMTDDLYSIDLPEESNHVAEGPGIEKLVIEQPTVFNYLGENNRYMLIVIHNPKNEFLSAIHLEMLSKILAGKKMELRDVAILNLNAYPTANFSQLKAFFAFKNLVLFGINPSQIGLSELGNNETIQIEQSTVLATFSLAEMESDDEKKRKFWNQMKKL